MRHFFTALLATALALPVVCMSAIDETIRIKETIEINAPADKVWDKLGNFGDMGAWHPAVAKTEIVDGTNNTVGAKRMLTLQDGGKINEVLTTHDVAGMTFKYEIIESVLPVREYASTIKVKTNGDGKSVVTWIGSFKRKDPANPGAPGQDDKAAKDIITSIYKGGLENLKKVSE